MKVLAFLYENILNKDKKYKQIRKCRIIKSGKSCSACFPRHNAKFYTVLVKY